MGLHEKGGVLAAPIIYQVFRTFIERFGSLGPIMAELTGNDILRKTNIIPEDIPVEQQKEACILATLRLLTNERQLARLPSMLASDWRIIHYALAGARTFREALTRCVECFEAFNGRCGVMSLQISDGFVDVRLDSIPMRNTPDSCLITLCSIGLFHDMMCWLIARSVPIETISLQNDVDTFENLNLPNIGAQILLSADYSGYRFDSAFLTAPVIRTVDELRNRSHHRLLFEIQSEIRSDNVENDVRRIVLGRLQESQQMPSFNEVAKAFGISIETLRRRLTSVGTTYRIIKDDIRRTVAHDLLVKSQVSIDDISRKLDYCNSNAFRLTFRKWFGISPLRYRERESRLREEDKESQPVLA